MISFQGVYRLCAFANVYNGLSKYLPKHVWYLFKELTYFAFSHLYPRVSRNACALELVLSHAMISHLCFRISSFASLMSHGPTPPSMLLDDFAPSTSASNMVRDESSTFHFLHRLQNYMASCMLYMIISSDGKNKKALGNHPAQVRL